LDKTQLFALVVVIVMVASTIGFGLLSYQPPAQSSPTPKPSEKILDYKAENVQVTVLQTLPTIRFASETSSTNIFEIDSAIYALSPSITRVSSESVLPPKGSDAALVYVATVSFRSDLSPEDVLDLIASLPLLSNIEAKKFALVQLPEEIEMHLIDAPAIKETHSFDNRSSEALVGFNTLPGDILAANVLLSLKGNQVVKLIASETNNLTAAKQNFSFTGSFTIQELEKTLLVDGSFTYNGLTQEEINQRVSALPEISSSSIVFSEDSPTIILLMDSNLGMDVETRNLRLNMVFVDLNTWIPSAGIDDTNPNKFFIEFNREIPFQEFKENLIRSLKFYTFTEDDFTLIDPIVSVSGTVELSPTAQASLAASKIQDIFSQEGISIDVFQIGSISLPEVFNKDLNQTFFNEAETVVSFLQPTHKIGDSANLRVSYIISRGQLSYIEAVEE